MRLPFVHSVLLAAILAAAVACTDSRPAFKATDISGVDWGGEFELTAHTGQRVKLSDYRGRLTVLFFGYTHCPDICAPTLALLARALDGLGADAGRVQVLFVSVDPGHDTPAQLAGFIPTFHPSFVGLTGGEAEVRAVAADYKIGYQASPGAGGIDHSGGVYVKDARGRLRLLVRQGAPVDDIVHDLRLLLKETP
ncbi:MAG: hypothetical protein A2150_04700 [Candidatus Muproteobacteria bacterium RBG_16_64_11]|uniref:Thioredoxin domain-containing protein n=1 Tax=Candidatus Muproteobacteria bacterium RBG_16_64_11 TaxID=1817758 RepID=A0A1F6TB86_9PROT|nr:MAG: hypothetical protein A2150_04700 [Candidatus Muproteobacteria bacterium RBG_16_64_11]